MLGYGGYVPFALEVYALVLDLDKRSDGTPLDENSARNALHVLKQKNLRHAVHSTFNHRPPDKVSLRPVIPLSKPVAGRDWPAFWKAAVKDLGIHVEESCCNADRFWYLPSLSTTSTTDPWCEVHDGDPLDVDRIMSIAAARSGTAGVDIPDAAASARERICTASFGCASARRLGSGALNRHGRT